MPSPCLRQRRRPVPRRPADALDAKLFDQRAPEKGDHARSERDREIAPVHQCGGRRRTDQNITAEVNRYIANPGQALAYKIGELTFRRMRSEAEAALGDRFDVRAFHDYLLGAGALPMDVVETRMRAWIAAQQAAN